MTDPVMSSWAIAANKILFAVAYRDLHRGFVAMGDLLPKALAVKQEYVQMAEDAERHGEPMPTQEFNAMCREGFQRLLGTV